MKLNKMKLNNNIIFVALGAAATYLFLEQEKVNVLAEAADPLGSILDPNTPSPMSPADTITSQDTLTPTAPQPDTPATTNPLGSVGVPVRPVPPAPVPGAPRIPRAPQLHDPCAVTTSLAAFNRCIKVHPFPNRPVNPCGGLRGQPSTYAFCRAQHRAAAPRPRPRPAAVNICKTPGLHPQCIPAGRRIKATTLGHLPGTKAPKFTVIGTNTGLIGAVDPIDMDMIDDAGGQFDDDTDTIEFDTSGYSERAYEIPDPVDGYLNTNRVDITMS